MLSYNNMEIKQYEPLINRERLAYDVQKYIMGDNYFTEYKQTEYFEKKIKDFLGVKYCSVTNNGTISLALALLAYGIKPGDKVLVPDITMIATCNAVKLIGAEPIFVDIDMDNFCMNLDKAFHLYVKNESVSAIIYVTFNGRSHTRDVIDNFETLCLDHNVKIIYDNAQAFGSQDSYGNYISCFSTIGSFSFSMPKIITTGQGGCLVTNNDYLGNKIKKLKDFGRTEGGLDIHDEFGINSKFTDIQAIMGLNQIDDILYRIERKKQIYNFYKQNTSGYILDLKDNETPWFIDIYVSNRDRLQKYLKDHGIQTRKMYPRLHRQKCNQPFITNSIVQSTYLEERGLWLPSSMSLTDDQLIYICENFNEFR